MTRATRLGSAFSEMAGVYRAWAHRLVGWISAAEAGDGVDSLIASLVEMETFFLDRARRVGERLESERVRLSRQAGHDNRLRELAVREGVTAEFEEAESAVAEVARLRVTALREVERMRDGMRDELDKIAGARRLVKRYTRSRPKGGRVDGKV